MSDEAVTINGTGMRGAALSEDGEALRLDFGHDDNDAPVSYLLPVARLPELLVQMTALADQLRVAGRLPPAGAPAMSRVAKTWKVGGSPSEHLRRFTALLFDEGATTETMLLMPDLDALKMADAIEQKVLAGLPPGTQAKLMQQVERESGRARIIVPSGKGRPN